MDKILHHVRNPEMMIHLSIPTNTGFHGFFGGAGFRPSTVWNPDSHGVSTYTGLYCFNMLFVGFSEKVGLVAQTKILPHPASCWSGIFLWLTH